jgi:hypothetical protein
MCNYCYLTILVIITAVGIYGLSRVCCRGKSVTKLEKEDNLNYDALAITCTYFSK